MICEDCDEIMEEIPRADYVDALLRRGRVVTLHGIGLLRCRCGDAPIYSFLTQLIELVNSKPEVREFYWNAATRSWTIDNNHHLGGTEKG